MSAEIIGPTSQKLDEPQIEYKYQAMQHKLMNLLNTTLYEKYVDP